MACCGPNNWPSSMELDFGKWEAWPISNSNLWIEPEIFVLESNSSHQKLGFSNQRMQISEQSANRQRQWELFRHQRLLIAPNILSPPSKLHPCENSSSIHFHTRTVGGLIHIQGRHLKAYGRRTRWELLTRTRRWERRRHYLGIDGAGAVDSYLFLFWGCLQGFFIFESFVHVFYPPWLAARRFFWRIKRILIISHFADVAQRRERVWLKREPNIEWEKQWEGKRHFRTLGIYQDGQKKENILRK